MAKILEHCSPVHFKVLDLSPFQKGSHHSCLLCISEAKQPQIANFRDQTRKKTNLSSIPTAQTSLAQATPMPEKFSNTNHPATRNFILTLLVLYAV